MPVDREPDHIARSAASYRRQLIDATEGVDIAAPPFHLRVSNVPLFREVDGALRQAVRGRVHQPGDAGPLTLRILDGTTVLDQQDTEATAMPQSVFLMVPEVEQPRRLTVQAVSGEEVIATAPIDVTPQRKWTIHLVHHSHYDIGYTDPQAEVMASQLGFIDGALELATVTDDWPDDARFRWNIEVNWPLREWLRTRPKSARDELARRIGEGRIEANALPFSMHTEAYSFDELARQVAFARELRERHGIDVVTAMQTDVPGATVGLATLLTDAGVKYLSVAHNYAGRSIPHLRDGQDLTRPFYWQAPDGERLLVWYTDTLYGVAYMEAMTLGFGAGYDDVLGSLPEYLAALAQLPWPYGRFGDWLSGSLEGVELTKAPYPHDILHLRVQGAFADNASPSLLPAEIARAWGQRWAYPRLRMSLNRDFFEDVERRLGDELDTFEGDWTDWWADGIGSAAGPLGKNRQSQADIRTAQTLNALAEAIAGDPAPEVWGEVDRAYEEMALFDEHTWGAANPWLRGETAMASGEYQWTRKAAFAYTAEERVRTLLDGGLRRIAPLAAASTRADLGTLLVFNPSSFARTDLARVFLPERSLEPGAFELVDLASGDTVPHLLEPQSNAPYRPRGRWIRFLARDVPAIGYARYALRSGGAPVVAGIGAGDGGAAIASERLAVEVDLATATIRSFVDRATGTELVAPDAPFGFNAWIYDRYASAPRFNHLSSRLGPAGPWLLGSRGTASYGLVVARESNAVWERLRYRYTADGADWAETTLTLPRGVPRLHISNRLHKPVTMEKESLYFAFPFALDDAAIAFEITGGVVGPDSLRVPGSAHHFRAIRHWATLEAAGAPAVAWATREAPLVQVGNIHLPYAPFPTTIPAHEAHEASIYSWALNNIWDTNFPPAQGGELTFAYTVAVGDGGPADQLGRNTGAATAMPLVGVMAPLWIDHPSSLPDRSSFATVDDPAVEVSHLAPARDGSGVAIWLVSHADTPVETALRVAHLPVDTARVGTYLETEMEDVALDGGAIPVTIAPGEMKVAVIGLGG